MDLQAHGRSFITNYFCVLYPGSLFITEHAYRYERLLLKVTAPAPHRAVASRRRRTRGYSVVSLDLVTSHVQPMPKRERDHFAHLTLESLLGLYSCKPVT